MTFIPSFNKHQILKAEMLDALRDNPNNFIKILYEDYCEGIIDGFSVTIDTINNNLKISPGILKLDDLIYIIHQPLYIDIKNGRNFVYLNIDKNDTKENNGQKLSFKLLNETIEHPSKIELFRYYKSETSELNQPKNFRDILVEASNTINYIYSFKSIKGGQTLRNEVFEIYAKEILSKTISSTNDIVFAYESLNGISNTTILETYFKLQNQCSNTELLEIMNNKLKEIESKNIENKKCELPKKVATNNKMEID